MNALDAFTAARPDVEVDDGVLEAIAADVFDGRRPRSGVRWRVLGVAAAAVALIAGLAFVVGRPDPSVPADTVPPALPDDGEPLRMLPGDLEGATLTGFLSPQTTSSISSTVLARRMDDGSYVDKVTVQRGPTAELWIDMGELATQNDLPVNSFGRGSLAWDVVGDPSGVTAQAEMGDGTVLQVVLLPSDDVARSRSIATDVAVSLSGVNQPPSGVAFDPLPSGFTVVADWAVSDPWSRYVGGTVADGTLFNVVTYATDDAAFAFRLMGSDLRPLTVRDSGGYASTWLGGQVLIWQERPGHWALLASADPDTTVGDLVLLATSLRVVTAEEWDATVQPPPGPESGVPATTAPAGPAPATSAPPASTAPSATPTGRVLVANGSGVGGLGATESSTLRRQGADVLEPVNARGPSALAIAGSRVFVRPGFEELGQWVANEYGVEDPEPIDSMLNITIDVSLDDADVVLVLGLDAAAAAIGGGDGATAPVVIGDSVTLGAEEVLGRRGYLVDAAVSRVLRDAIPRVAEIVDAVHPEVLVLQLATNGPFVQADLDALQDAVADVPNVILVNAHADRTWVDVNNALLAGLDRPDDNLIVLDWDVLADECPGECFAEDGIHLTLVGATFFAERLGEITGY